MSAKVHDKFVRKAMGFNDLAISFLKYFINPLIIAHIQLKKLAFESESHVTEDMKEIISDLIFTVPIGSMQASIYFVVEHKSQGSVRKTGLTLPWQMKRAQIGLMEKYRQGNKKGTLPLVYCMGLYHGNKAYDGPRNIGSQIEAPQEIIPAAWMQDEMIIDLSLINDDEILQQDNKLAVFLLVLKHIYDDNPIEALEKLQSKLASLEFEQDGLDFIKMVVRYLLDTSEREYSKKIVRVAVQSLSDEGGGEVVTAADALREEGKIEAQAEILAERSKRIEAERERQEEQRKRQEEQRKREEEQRKREEEQRKRQEEQRKRQEEQRKREASEEKYRQLLVFQIKREMADGQSFKEAIISCKVADEDVAYLKDYFGS